MRKCVGALFILVAACVAASVSTASATTYYQAVPASEVSGNGALRKIKVRFAKAGERTFLAEKARLAIVGGN